MEVEEPSTDKVRECEAVEFANRFEEPLDEQSIKKMEELIKKFPNLFEAKDKLPILRSCIQFLSRLDTTQNALAGRVLIFLAKLFSLYDQSGINMRSEFNTRELPETVRINLEKLSSKNVDMEEGETFSDDENEPETIYEKFWKVQKLLLQPNQLFDKHHWSEFRTDLEAVIREFEIKPPRCQVWNVKYPYMTDIKSFTLQLNDVNMRNCFMVQILIILQYIGLPVDTRPETMTLDQTQLGWSTNMTKRIFALLQNDLIAKILKSEEMWNSWKNKKCKEPKKPEDDDDDMINMGVTYHKRRKLSDELKSAKPYNMHVIGSQQMSKLWNKRPNQKFNRPNVVEYFNIPPEQQQESFKDPNTSFRILRLLRKSPHFFVPTAAAIQSSEGYLKALADKHKIVNQNTN